jgi:hypothetical protein
MSEDGNFLSRWSRKKREAEELPPQAAAPAAKDAEPKESAAVAAPADGTQATRTEADEPKFDLASLPSIESIGADTDIRQFLRAGVPAELTRAALRRAWASDPAIRDYIGLSENSWNFNEPGAMYGFDHSDPGVDVRRLAEEMFGGGSKSVAEKPSELSAEEPKSAEVGAKSEAVAEVDPPDHDIVRATPEPSSENKDRVVEQQLTAAQDDGDVAPQHEPLRKEAASSPAPRRHGRALPS